MIASRCPFQKLYIRKQSLRCHFPLLKVVNRNKNITLISVTQENMKHMGCIGIGVIEEQSRRK